MMLRLYLARLIASIVRVGTLRIAKCFLRPLPASSYVVARRFNGAKLYVDISRGNLQQLLWLEGIRYVKEKNLLQSLIKPGMTIMDVGANLGYYALICTECLKGRGSILCLEPEPANLEELRRNQVNNRLGNLVTIMPVAAGNQNGTIRFRPGSSGRADAEGSLEVQTITIDSLGLGTL